jgi:hypothetical protein
MYPRGNDLDLGTIEGSEESLLLPSELRDKHLYVVGATGAGKSKFLENLIRQDILNHSLSGCGLLLIDPHGSLYDSLMAWMVRHDIKRPVIPIDLRRTDWVVSYNEVRQREGTDPAVLVDNLVDAMAHVWGQSGTDQTPLFARWAGNVLRALYEKKLTLVEADLLTNHVDKALRYALTADLEEGSSRNDWLFSQSLSPEKFEAQIGSTVNRLQRFLRNKTMRCMFGQPGASLDLGKALNDGSIILVSAATEGGQVSKENGSLFATLLLCDLWTAAQERGKKKGVKPFYLYLDEFQRFVTPTIAENLNEARGYGLHLTMAHQFPLQLLDEGDHGKKVFHSVMENASSKIGFRLTYKDNLEIIAQWLFMGVMDPDEIKQEMFSTKVMQYVEEMRHTYGVAFTEGSASGKSTGSSRGLGEGGTESFRGIETEIEPVSTALSGSQFEANSEVESQSQSESVSHSKNVAPFLKPVIGQEISSRQYRPLDEQLHRAMAVLFDQEQRQGVARLVGMKAPVSIETPFVSEHSISANDVTRYVSKLYKRLPFAVKRQLAEQQIKDRETALKATSEKESPAELEPVTTRRRIG